MSLPILDIYRNNAFSQSPTLTPLIADIPYTNLQWSRKWYDVGQFAVDIPSDSFDGIIDPFSFLTYYGRQMPYFVAMPNRQNITGARELSYNGHIGEIGLIQSVSYDEDSDTFTLSGLFAETVLDWAITLSRQVSVNKYLYEACNNLWNSTTTVKTPKMYVPWADWEAYNVSGAPSECAEKLDFDFDATNLGSKFRNWGETRLTGFRVGYSQEAKRIQAGCVYPRDRSAAVFFSDTIGNITGAKIERDYSAYRSECWYRQQNSDGTQIIYGYENQDDTAIMPSFCLVDDSKKGINDGQSYSDYIKGVIQDAREKLQNYSATETISANGIGDSGYLTLYDLGDVVSLKIHGNVYVVQIVEVNEVYKNGLSSVELVFGSRRFTNIEKAINRK